MNYMIKKNDKLPIEYQEVEYIESTGTQYIDTGVSPDNSTGLKVIFSDLTVAARDFNFIGSRLQGSSRFMINYTDGNFGYGWDGYYTTNESINVSMKNTAELNFYNNMNFIANGNTLANLSTIAILNMPTIYIFGQHAQTNNLYSYKVYECEITQDDLLIRKFIPCYRKSDNKVGMYDLVNDVFYTNAGTGSFTKGAVVALPSEYQEVEYIQSSGAQFIDTGYVPVVGDSIEVDNVICNRTTSFQSIFSAGTGDYQLILLVSSLRLAPSVDSYYKYFSTGGASEIHINLNSATNIISNSDGLYYNSIRVGTNYDTGTVNTNLYLLKRANDTSYATATLGCVRIYHNNTLVRNFIPCYRKSDNVIGLYDLVNGVFYTNDGTGTFLKGDNVLAYQSMPIGVLKNKKTPNLLKLNRTEWNSTSYQPTSLVPFDYNQLYYMASSGYIRPKDNSLNETITESSVTFTQTNSSWWGIGFPFEVKPNTKYTISAKRDDGDKTKIMYALYDADGSFKSYAQLTTNISILDISLTITTGANTKTMVIVVAGITQGNTVYAYDLQVEEGQTRTQYKPYGYEVSITYNAIKTYNE